MSLMPPQDVLAFRVLPSPPRTGHEPATLPAELPAGTSAFLHGADALRAGGLWPQGWPSRLLHLRAQGKVSVDGVRVSAPGWEVLEEVDVEPHLRSLAASFEDCGEELFEEMREWRKALARPGNDPEAVEALLQEALQARDQRYWTLRRMRSVGALRTRWAPHAQGVYSWSTHAAFAAWTGWEEEAELDPYYENLRRLAWSAWYRPGDGVDTDEAADLAEGPALEEMPWDVWDAFAGLVVHFGASQGWIDYPEQMLTEGLRDAYLLGLGMAYPIEPGVLGWAMIR